MNKYLVQAIVLIAACLLSYYIGKLVGFDAGVDYAVSNIQCTVQQEINNEPRILQ